MVDFYMKSVLKVKLKNFCLKVYQSFNSSVLLARLYVCPFVKETQNIVTSDSYWLVEK